MRMRKTEYYEEMKKYEELVKLYHFNPLLGDTYGFENTRMTLIDELNCVLREMEEDDILRKKTLQQEYGIEPYEDHEFLRLEGKIMILLSEISQKKCIERDDYIDSYYPHNNFVLNYFGDWLFIWGLTAIISLILAYFFGWV